MGNMTERQEFSTPRNSDNEADVEGHGLVREGFTGTTKREGAILRSGETADDDVEGHGLKLRSPSSRGE